MKPSQAIDMANGLMMKRKLMKRKVMKKVLRRRLKKKKMEDPKTIKRIQVRGRPRRKQLSSDSA